MQTYNSFNEMATANSAAPLVSDMSVFNAAPVTMEQAKEIVKAALDARKAYAAAMERFDDALNKASMVDDEADYDEKVVRYLESHDHEINSSAF